MQQQLATEGREIFRKLVALPDKDKNGPAPTDLQEQFTRWRRKVLAAEPSKTQAARDTQEPYVRKLTVRLLAYNLEQLLHEGE